METSQLKKFAQFARRSLIEQVEIDLDDGVELQQVRQGAEEDSWSDDKGELILNESMLKVPEGKTLEYKQDLSSPRNFLKTLVAFANTAGGRLTVDVSDDRQVVGVENPLDEEERLSNLIADSIAPWLAPNIEMMTVEGKTLLVVEVYLSGTRPHYIRAAGRENSVYVRLGSSNRQADRELIAELRRSVEGIAFDEMPMPELSVDDLNLEAARALFKGKRVLDEQELLTLKQLRKEQGRLVPTKGAMLLFGKERLFHFPDAWMQCGRFIGTDKADIFDHIELHDPLPLAMRAAQCAVLLAVTL